MLAALFLTVFSCRGDDCVDTTEIKTWSTTQSAAPDIFILCSRNEAATR